MGGRLTDLEKDRALLWLRTHWNRNECPYHVGPTRWNLGDVMIQTLPYAGPGGGIIAGGSVYPLLVLTCEICGQSVFINAIVAGIVPREVPAEPAPAGPPAAPPQAESGDA